MEVLSIDLDYIMYPDIEFYNSILYDSNPCTRWKNLQCNGYTKKDRPYAIDQSNLMFCFNTFLKAIKNCNSVSFGYEHDSIMYALEDCEDIHLINIDHHDDFVNGFYQTDGYQGLAKEYDLILEDDRFDEGNWIAWLNIQGKLSSYTWIGNPIENKMNCNRSQFMMDRVKDCRIALKEDCTFNTYSYDHVYVCLSPQYMPPEHWHYFSMFLSAYEEFSGKTPIIHVEKYNNKHRLKSCHDKIVNNFS